MTPQLIQELPSHHQETSLSSLHSAILTAAQTFIKQHKELQPESFQIIYIEQLKPPPSLDFSLITDRHPVFQTLTQLSTGTIIIDTWPNHNYCRQFIEYLQQNQANLAQAYNTNLARVNIIHNLLQTLTLLPQSQEIRSESPLNFTNTLIDLVICFQQPQPPLPTLDELNQQIQPLINQIESLSPHQTLPAAKALIDLIHQINHH